MKWLNRLYILVALAVVSCAGKVEKHTGLRAELEGLEDKTQVILAGYLGERLYPKDTFYTDAKGAIYVADLTKYEKGMYALVAHPQDTAKATVIDLILAGEDFVHLQAQAGKRNESNHVKVLVSEENKILYDYLELMSAYQTKMKSLEEQFQTSFSDDLKAKVEEEIKAETEALNKTQEQIIAGSLYANKMLALAIAPLVPEPPVTEQNIDLWKSVYYRQHFWDNVDFTDESLARSGFFERKLNNYLSLWPLEGVQNAVDELIVKIPEKTEVYKVALLFFLTKFQHPSGMCLDSIFVHLVDQYVKTDKAFWLTADAKQRVIEQAENMAAVTCGKQAPDIRLMEPSGRFTSLYSIPSDYTVVVFWSHQCGHCVRDLPVMAEKMKKYAQNKVKVFAVEVEIETEGWIDFLKKNPLVSKNFINVSDTKDMRDNAVEYINSGKTTLESLNYRKVYGIYATPTILLLDKEKKILYKNLSVETLDQILSSLLNDNMTKN